MKIKILLFALAALISVPVLAQEGGIKGRVVTRTGRMAIDDAKVSLSGPQSKVVYTDSEGVFEFRNLVPGAYKVLVDALDFQAVELTVNVEQQMKDLNFISLVSDVAIGGLDDSDFAEFDMESANDAQAMPVTLSASKDVYDNIAGYKFSTMRFRNRGYETGTAGVYLNGVYFNDAMTGYTPWSLWSGLNDATRNQEVTGAMGISDYGVGAINGVTNINARASQIRKGFRGSVVNASGQYRFRVMATYASGMKDNGWAYAFSASTRQGGNDWVNGVYYNSWAYFASVEKQFDYCNTLALTVLGAPTIRGVQAASTQEVYDLVGSNYYNPNWGYQGGRSKSDMRNARVRNSHEPIVMLNYYFEPSTKFKLQAAVSYRFGKNGYSALDWYDTQDPRPDYYRNLPSYFEDDPLKAAWVTEGWHNDWNIRQINWDALYNVNYGNYFDMDFTGGIEGITKRYTRSKYVIEERRTDQQDLNAKVQITSIVHNNSTFNAGLEYRWNKTAYFKKLKDLLGGDYWLDVDQFAERDFPTNSDAIQNNLLTPNRLVTEGDKYGYNYLAHLQSGKLWATYELALNHIEAYVAAEGGFTSFYREGLYKKGLFPNDSYGNSERQNFWTYTAKAGVTGKISGSHTLWANVAYMHRAPYFQDAFVSPRTRNSVAPGLTTEKTFGVDLNYMLRLGGFRMRVSGYYTTIKDQNKLISFYDDLNRSYTNFAMRGIDEMHAGLEVGMQAPLVGGLSLKGAFSYGYYKYTSNPYVTQTVDNSNRVILENERVYWKNYKVGGTPQTALSAGLDYRSRRNLFLGVDVGWYDALYIDMNPLYRTDYAHVGLTNEQSQAMAHQEMFPSAFLLNANIGKSWYIHRKYNLGFSLEVKNLLNRQNIKTGGYEQMRLKKVEDPATGEVDHYSPFPSKYFYLFGTTYYLNLYFRF